MLKIIMCIFVFTVILFIIYSFTMVLESYMNNDITIVISFKNFKKILTLYLDNYYKYVEISNLFPKIKIDKDDRRYMYISIWNIHIDQAYVVFLPLSRLMYLIWLININKETKNRLLENSLINLNRRD